MSPGPAVPHRPRPSAADGVPLRIRPARLTDRPHLAEMLTRCSLLARQRRFLAPLRYWPERYLAEAVQGGDEHFALVAATPAAVVALASCRTVGGDVADLAVLVEDAYQRQGIGACLVNRLVEHADANGLRTLKATVQADQPWIVQALSACGTCRATIKMDVFEVALYRAPGTRAPAPRREAHR